MLVDVAANPPFSFSQCSYQSQFGKDPWLKPATDETLETLAHEGIKRVAVITPGFLRLVYHSYRQGRCGQLSCWSHPSPCLCPSTCLPPIPLSSDCLETIDENGVENNEVFLEAGGAELIVVPCVNSDAKWCAGAAEIIRAEAAGWE